MESVARPIGRWVASCLLALSVLLPEGRASAQQVTYMGTLTYSTGTYVFVERTHSLWLSSSLALRAGPLTMTGSLPVIAQNSGVVSFVAGQPLPTGGESNGAVGERGMGKSIGSRGPGSSSTPMGSADSTVVFRDQYEVQVGDPLLSAAFEVFQGTGLVRSVSIQGAAKAPLRSLESGVGTGEWDFGGGGSLVLGSGLTLALIDASYWSFGDLPELALGGSLLYSVGVSRAVMDARGSVLVSVSGATRIIDTEDPPLSAGVGFLISSGSGKMLSLGASAGLTEASPDVSVYVGWSLRL